MNKNKAFFTLIIIICLGFLTTTHFLEAVTFRADATFDPGDFKNGLAKASPTIFAVQSDGKILVGGDFSSYDNNDAAYLIRMNTDASYDSTFVLDGSGLEGKVEAIAIQSDGKILVGGWFTTYNSSSSPYIVRLNSDGSPDTTFDQTGSGLAGGNYIDDIEIQSDGKILAKGDFTSYNGTAAQNIIRLNADGSHDTSFTSGLTSGNTVDGIELQSDDSIIIFGGSGVYAGTNFKLARLSSDGSIDGTFTTPNGLDDDVSDVVILDDDSIITAGAYTEYDGEAVGNLLKFSEDGELDSSYATNADGFGGGSEYPANISKLSGSTILANGAFNDFNGLTAYRRVMTFSSDGTANYYHTFGSAGTPTITHAAQLSDGGYLFIGTFSLSEFGSPAVQGFAKVVPATTTPGISRVFASSSPTTSEGDSAGLLHIFINSIPDSDVTVTFSSDGQATTSVESVCFNSDGSSGCTLWSSYATTTVTVVDDVINEDDTHTGEITYTVSSSDGNYSALTLATTTVSISDNDEPGLLLNNSATTSTSSTNLSEDTLATGSVGIRINPQPSSDVEVSCSINTAQATIQSPSFPITFTNVTYSATQTVSVVPVADGILEPGLQRAIVTCTASSSDSDFNGLSNIFYFEIDDDEEAIQQQVGRSSSGSRSSISAGSRSSNQLSDVISILENASLSASLSEVLALLREFYTVQASDQAIPSSSDAADSSRCFATNLTSGSSGVEVSRVQQFLKEQGFFTYPSITQFFGPVTRQAVADFQNAHALDILTPLGLTQGTGNWFGGTRAFANTLAGCN